MTVAFVALLDNYERELSEKEDYTAQEKREVTLFPRPEPKPKPDPSLILARSRSALRPEPNRTLTLTLARTLALTLNPSQVALFLDALCRTSVMRFAFAFLKAPPACMRLHQRGGSAPAAVRGGGARRLLRALPAGAGAPATSALRVHSLLLRP